MLFNDLWTVLFYTLLWVKPWLILCIMILVQGFVVFTEWPWNHYHHSWKVCSRGGHWEKLWQLHIVRGNLGKCHALLKYLFPYSNICISNKMQRYTVYFTWKLLYMFWVVPPPIIRSANNCTYSIWYLSHRYCRLPLSWKRWNRFECAVGGVCHPQHTQTSSTILLDIY